MSFPYPHPPNCACLPCLQRKQSPGAWTHSQIQASSASTYTQMVLLQETRQPSQVLPKEIVAAPVEGWRIWTVYPPMRLGAVGIGVLQWDPVERARCRNRNPLAGQHPAPAPDCGCGLWAFKDVSPLHDTLRQYAGGNQVVFGYGRVQLWGKIIECEHGWRGEYARPLEVTLLGADDTTAQAIREFYGCDVTVEAVPEWLRAERAKYWQPHRMNIQPSGQPAVTFFGMNFPQQAIPAAAKRERPFFPLLCLALAIVNAVFACLGAFGHNGDWPMNAAAALGSFFAAYLCWSMP